MKPSDNLKISVVVGDKVLPVSIFGKHRIMLKQAAKLPDIVVLRLEAVSGHRSEKLESEILVTPLASTRILNRNAGSETALYAYRKIAKAEQVNANPE